MTSHHARRLTQRHCELELRSDKFSVPFEELEVERAKGANVRFSLETDRPVGVYLRPSMIWLSTSRNRHSTRPQNFSASGLPQPTWILLGDHVQIGYAIHPSPARPNLSIIKRPENHDSIFFCSPGESTLRIVQPSSISRALRDTQDGARAPRCPFGLQIPERGRRVAGRTRRDARCVARCPVL